MPIISYHRISRGFYGGAVEEEAQTLSLIHFEAADAATEDEDEVALTGTWVCNANARIDTEQFKFGASSIRFAGNGSMNASATEDTNPLLDFTTFTIEYWLRFSDAAEDVSLQANASDNVGTTDTSLFLGVNLIAETMTISVNDRAGDSQFDEDVAIGTIDVDTWYHVALSVDLTAGTAQAYFNGTRVFNGTGFDGVLDISRYAVGAGQGGAEANIDDPIYIDEFRFSSIARYSGATITVPSAAFEVD